MQSKYGLKLMMCHYKANQVF